MFTRGAFCLYAALGIGIGSAAAQQPGPLPEAGVPRQAISGDSGRGRDVIMRMGCVACHVIPGIPGPFGKVGPDLNRLAGRAYIGGGVPNTPDNLVDWIVNPPRFAPRTAMPEMGISRDAATDIARYLYNRGSR